MRVHELAKTLKLSSKELLEKLHKLGVEAKSHMTRLDEETLELLKEELASPKEAPSPPPQTSVSPPKDVLSPPLEEAQKAPEASFTAVAEPIRVEIPITVGNLASKLKVKVSELIKTLMGLGVFANVNQLLGEEVVFKAAAQLGLPLEKLADEEEGKFRGIDRPAKEEKFAKPRQPVVTLMGHVDHGKTTLLDAVRKSNVAAREAGQITQHIGAYVVDLPGKGHVTFLDTPGHEAFTAMRARGANVTDIVVLVVAADDGVMPQTIEAMDHAREAGVPIVVAINKCDLPQANPQKVMMQLQKLVLVPEEWGGKTIFCKVSAKTGEGIDHLLEMLLLEAEILELRANPESPAQGTIIESRLTKGMGPVATVLVQKGTLRLGDAVIAGSYFGRVRALKNDRGKTVREATPSFAVEVHGINGVPEAGEILWVAPDLETARRMAEKRLFEIRERQQRGIPKRLSLETLHEQIQKGGFKELKLILKADVQGSVEALTQSLEKLSTNQVHLHVIHGGVGGVNESDVMLAAASDAIIIGFNVKAEPRAQELREREGVEVRFYTIIYEAVEDVRKAMEGLLEPTYQEVVEGRAEIRRVFHSTKTGTVGGGVVLKGKLSRGSKLRLLRAQTVIFEGKFASLKRFKEDVREVGEGYEFGFILEGFSELREGDLLEAYHLEKGAPARLK